MLSGPAEGEEGHVRQASIGGSRVGDSGGVRAGFRDPAGLQEQLQILRVGHNLFGFDGKDSLDVANGRIAPVCPSQQAGAEP